jgi:uncharacterized membrane protein
MPVKKTPFAIANFFLLAIFVFLGLSIFPFIIEVVPSDESLLPLLPLISSFLIIIINCLFNLANIRKPFPDKTVSKQRITLYSISGILFTISILIVLFQLIGLYNEELKENPNDSFVKVILFLILIILITGLIIVINQFNIIKYLKGNQKRDTEGDCDQTYN